MKIGIDFDGTLADTNTQKSLWIKKNLKKVVPVYFCDKTTCLNHVDLASYKTMGLDVYSTESTLNLIPIKGSIEFIENWKDTAEIVIVTARNGWRLDDAIKWIEKNLNTRNIAVIGMDKKAKNKGEVCEQEQIDIFIDDDKRHLETINSKEVKCILFKHDAPESIIKDSADFKVCTSWADISKEVAELI